MPDCFACLSIRAAAAAAAVKALQKLHLYLQEGGIQQKPYNPNNPALHTYFSSDDLD